MRRGLHVTCALSTFAFVLGCGGAADDGEGTSQSLSSKLDGRTFVSESVQGYTLVAGTEVRVSFSENNCSVNAGCNTMGGTYRIDGNVFRSSEWFSTLIGCDPALGAQENWVSNLFLSSPTMTLDEPRLLVQGTAGSITFLDREIASPDLPLVGTHWVLNASGDGQVATSGIGYDRATIGFDATGNVTVFTACQTGVGRFTADASNITFDGLAYDGATCADPTLDSVSQIVLSVLDGSPVTYAIEEKQLTITLGANTLYFIGG